MPLSAKQTYYLSVAWECFESEPKIDYEKFATLANLASANSARELMRVTKKKLKEQYGSTPATTAANSPGTPKTKTATSGATPGSRKRSTPATGGKKGKKGVASRAADVDEDDGEVKGCEMGEGNPVKKRKAANGVEIKSEVVEDESDGALIDDEEGLFQ